MKPLVKITASFGLGLLLAWNLYNPVSIDRPLATDFTAAGEQCAYRACGHAAVGKPMVEIRTGEVISAKSGNKRVRVEVTTLRPVPLCELHVQC